MTCKRQIFRVGTHTPMQGNAIEFTEPMLRAAVDAYDPALHEAPIVIGHPKGDAPAYGWIKSLEFLEGHVVAEEHQVASEFSEARDAGRYKKVSAAWYMPDAPGNPKPGSMYLKHLGYLGAAAPAIKGLRTVNFAASNEGVFEFGSWGQERNASMWRRLREFVIEKFGSETADKVVPDWDVKALEEEARDEHTPSLSHYTEPQEPSVLTQEQLAAKEESLARREAALAPREAAITQQESTARLAANVAFAEALVREGRLLPAQVAGVAAFMASLDASGVVEFGEGDQKKTQPSIDWLKSFLTSMPKQVEFSEVARPDGTVAINVDDSTAVARAAVEFREKERAAGREIDTVAAVTHVIKTNTAK